VARLDELRAEARFRRERLDLYRAREYAGKPTSPGRLRELQRESDAAQARLDAAVREAGPPRPV